MFGSLPGAGANANNYDVWKGNASNDSSDENSSVEDIFENIPHQQEPSSGALSMLPPFTPPGTTTQSSQSPLQPLSNEVPLVTTNDDHPPAQEVTSERAKRRGSSKKRDGSTPADHPLASTQGEPFEVTNHSPPVPSSKKKTKKEKRTGKKGGDKDTVLGVDTDELVFQLDEAHHHRFDCHEEFLFEGDGRRNLNAAVTTTRHAEGMEDEPNTLTKPPWWFRLRRYFYSVTLISRVVCCLTVLVIGILVTFFHVPIYSALDALKNVHVPAYTAVRYTTDATIVQNSLLSSTALTGAPSCPTVSGSGVAFAGRHHNGSLDVSGRLYVHGSDALNSTQVAAAASILTVGTAAAAPSSSSTTNVGRHTVVPGPLLRMYASNDSATTTTPSNNSTDDAFLVRLSPFVAMSTWNRCAVDARSATLLSLSGTDAMWSYVDSDAAPWKRVASLNCTAETSVAMFASSDSSNGGSGGGNEVVSHTFVLCRCAFAPLASSLSTATSSWMRSPLLTQLLAQQRSARWSLHVTYFNTTASSLPSSFVSLGEETLPIAEAQPNSLQVHSDELDGGNSQVRSVVLSLVAMDRCASLHHTQSNACRFKLLQVVVLISKSSAASEVTTVPLYSKGHHHSSNDRSSSSTGENDGGVEEGEEQSFPSSLSSSLHSWSVTVSTLSAQRTSNVVSTGTDEDDGAPLQLTRWNMSTTLLMAMIVGGGGGTSGGATAQELRIVKLSWNLSFVSTIDVSASTSADGNQSVVAVEAANSATDVLSAVVLPAASGLCCGAKPLQLVGSAVIAPPATVTALGIVQASTDQELFLLGYRDCPMNLAQCVQTTKYPTSSSPSPQGAAYTSRLVSMKYSLSNSMLSAVLPLSMPSVAAANDLDNAAAASLYYLTTSVVVNITSGGVSNSVVGYRYEWNMLEVLAASSNNDDGTVFVHHRRAKSITFPLLSNITTTNNNSNNFTSTSRYVQLNWVGGYRLDGVVLPSTALCATTRTTISTSATLSIDVVIAGRLPFTALLGAPATAAVTTSTTTAVNNAIIGGWLCMGPLSQSVWIANIASASNNRRGGDASGADFCVGRAISEDEFVLW